MLKTPQRISPDTLDELKDIANENIDHVLSELGFDIDEVTVAGNEIRSVCPIHDGADNTTAFCYNTTYKYWRCYTKHCHEGFDNVFGLVQKVLGKKTGKEVSFRESISWLSKVLNYELDVQVFEPNEDELELSNLLRKIKRKKIFDNPEEKLKPFPVQLIDGKIEPSEYFLKQGFSKEIIRKYNIGYCDDPNKPMYKRAYAPVLNDSGDMVVGVTGRTIHPECEYCGQFHIQGFGCPNENHKIKGYPKWKHYGFQKNNVFYNINFAEESIRKTKTVVITEGPKDVWWLVQHGLDNCLCIFGLSTSDYHLRRLLNLGVARILVALNNDEKGIEAIEKLNNRFDSYFNMINVHKHLNGKKDIAQLPSEDMINRFVPYLKSLEVKNAK
jgi:DNA primase